VAGTQQVTVRTPAPGGGTSVALTLIVENPVPAISALSPALVPARGAPFTLIISGTGFVQASTVELDATPVTATFVSPTSLTTSLPTFADAGVHTVAVRNAAPGGGVSSGATLTVAAVAYPFISVVAPNPAPAGQPFGLTVSGANFECSSAGAAVLVDGVLASSDGGTCSATQLVVTAPPTDAGTSAVQVMNPNGDLSNVVNLAVVVPNPLPVVSSVSPSSVPMFSSAQTLVVSGSGFVPSSSVLVGGTARTTTFISDVELDAPLPASELLDAGVLPVAVQSPGPGGGTSGSVDFTVTFAYPKPSLSSVAPSLVVMGSGATTLTLTGSGFVSQSQATFNGANRATTFVSPTELQVALLAADANAPGDFAVTVVNPTPGGGTSNGLSVAVGNAVPTIGSLSPCGVVAGSGPVSLTLTGTGFASGATVKVGGTAVTATVVNATTMTATVPAALVAVAPADDALDVVVTNPSPGGGASNTETLGVASQAASLAADVQPIFTSVCAASCHAGPFGSGGLVLEAGVAGANLIGVTSNGCPSIPRVKACAPRRSQSFLADKLLSSFSSLPCSGGPMPAAGSLTPQQVQLIVDWIAQGAKP
jgi:hypothetical protein